MNNAGLRLIAGLALALPSLCFAQVEMNWQHIEAPDHLRIEMNTLPVGLLFDSPSQPADGLRIDVSAPPLRIVNGGRFGHLLTGRKLRINGLGTVPLTFTAQQGVCAFGFRLMAIDPHPQKKNWRQYRFTFRDTSGEIIGTQERSPAGGMTRQAYKSREEDAPFGSITIEELTGTGFGIRSVKAQPCAALSG